VLLLDLDNTLLPRDTNVVPDELKAWAADLRRRGFSVCLVSNNWHERVKHVADELGFELVDKAVKPLPFAFRAAVRRTGATLAETAVIGDQIFTDILGGNLLGMLTVLVSPLSATDLPHTLLLRAIEARILAGRVPDDSADATRGTR
jgi:HAD superfamily phosphatase (TIGR01668 family)